MAGLPQQPNAQPGKIPISRNINQTINGAIFRDCNNLEVPLKRASTFAIVFTIITFLAIIFTFLYDHFSKATLPAEITSKEKIMKVAKLVSMLSALLSVLAVGYMYPNVRKALTCPAT